MAIESLDIGSRIYGRIMKLIEAGNSVEDIYEHCEVTKCLYDSMLRSGQGRSQSDWEIEERQFEDMLEQPDDVPSLNKMLSYMEKAIYSDKDEYDE